MNIIKSIKNLKKYEIFIWLISFLSIIIAFLLFENKNYYTLIASLIGVTALIFVAKGDVLGQVLTICFSAFYGFISFKFAYYGEFNHLYGNDRSNRLNFNYNLVKEPL